MTISRFAKFTSLALVGALALGTVSAAEAGPRDWRYARHARHHNNLGPALVLGAFGALAVGAIIANQHHNDYVEPNYGYGPANAYGDPYADGYYQPAPVYQPAPYYARQHYVQQPFYAGHHHRHFYPVD